MKKYLYFLLLSTMTMYFTGCQDKKDEEVTLEINETNILGKWTLVAVGPFKSSTAMIAMISISGRPSYDIRINGIYICEKGDRIIKWDENGEPVYEIVQGKWELNGTKLILDKTYTIEKLSNKEMVLDDAGADRSYRPMYFMRL